MAGPIVLGSNITGNYGALPGDANYYVAPTQGPMKGMVENDDGTYTMPTYTRELYDTSGVDWSLYGTKYAPMVRYFKTVQGEDYVYDPKDDMISEEDANTLASDFENEFGMDAKEILKQEAIAVGGQLAAGIGAQAGRAVAAAGGIDSFGKGISDFTSNFDFLGGDIFRAPADGPGAKILNSPDSVRFTLDSFDGDPIAQKAFKTSFKAGNKDAIEAYQANLASTKSNFADANNVKLPGEDGVKFDKISEMEAKAKTASDNFNAISTGPTSGFFGGIKDRSGFAKGPGSENMSAAGKANIGGSLGATGITIAYNLASGKNLKKSVEAGLKVGLGTYVGGLFGPIGSMIGGLIGGRVICNELMRQGIMTRKQVALDYKFTEDYLTPQHVAGYHVWAVWMVRQMRKGRLVNFWTHVAGHRANEIAYIYGERETPDYLGKIYRKILEPICWSIGFFCKTTDWSVLYKQKEI